MATHTPGALLGLAREFMGSRILLSAAELDLFTLLSEQRLSAEQVAGAIGADRRRTTILLDALAGMHLLEKSEGAFHCPADVAALLSARSPTSILPMVLHAAGLWYRWSDLTPVVQRGWEAASSPSSPRQQEHFIGAMHVIGRSREGLMAAGFESVRLLEEGTRPALPSRKRAARASAACCSCTGAEAATSPSRQRVSSTVAQGLSASCYSSAGAPNSGRRREQQEIRRAGP